ncbi:hypothetical protein BGZ89_010886 [Linnemannia elongata]|nr:hypothetical protein BGZ89_010886 [Linnemannia elongata]
MRTRASTSSAGSSSQQTRQAIGEKCKLLGPVPAKRARTAKKSASNAERIESLQANALHNQTPTVIDPSVSLEKQEPSNALNSISSQVSQVQNTLAKFQGTVEHVDRVSQDVQKVHLHLAARNILYGTHTHTRHILSRTVFARRRILTRHILIRCIYTRHAFTRRTFTRHTFTRRILGRLINNNTYTFQPKHQCRSHHQML